MCLLTPEEGIGSPKTGVAGGCELPCGFWEPNSGRLQEQQVLLGHLYNQYLDVLLNCLLSDRLGWRVRREKMATQTGRNRAR